MNRKSRCSLPCALRVGCRGLASHYVFLQCLFVGAEPVLLQFNHLLSANRLRQLLWPSALKSLCGAPILQVKLPMPPQGFHFPLRCGDRNLITTRIWCTNSTSAVLVPCIPMGVNSHVSSMRLRRVKGRRKFSRTFVHPLPNNPVTLPTFA